MEDVDYYMIKSIRDLERNDIDPGKSQQGRVGDFSLISLKKDKGKEQRKAHKGLCLTPQRKMTSIDVWSSPGADRERAQRNAEGYSSHSRRSNCLHYTWTDQDTGIGDIVA